MGRDLSKLKERALQLVAKEKYGKAVEAYRELAAAEPANPRWHQKLGELHRKLGQTEEAVAAFDEAVHRLADAGFLVKAIALCKVILELDPTHVDTQAHLAELYAAQSPAVRPIVPGGAQQAVTGPAAGHIEVEPAPTEAAEPVRSKRRTIPPGASLDAVILRNVLPEARPHEPPSEALPSGVYEIPLEEVPSVDIPVVVVPPEGSSPQTGVGPLRPTALPSLPAIPLFSSLEAAALRSLIERVSVRSHEAGARIITQGETGDSLYVLVEGEAAVYREGTPRLEMSRLTEGAFFGEIALLTQTPRIATVEALTPLTVLEISRAVVGDLVEDHPMVLRVLLRFFRDRLVETLTRTSPLFAPFADEERSSLASRFAFIEADAESELLRRGCRAEGLYLVLCGDLSIREAPADASRSADLGPGSLIGETSLLTSEPSPVTVACQSKCWFLKLERREFREVIMTHPQVLAFLSQLVDERRAKGAPYQDQTIPLI